MAGEARPRAVTGTLVTSAVAKSPITMADHTSMIPGAAAIAERAFSIGCIGWSVTQAQAIPTSMTRIKTRKMNTMRGRRLLICATPSTARRIARASSGRSRQFPVVFRENAFMPVKMSASASSPVVALDRCEIECVEPERVASVLARLPDERVFQDLEA